MTAPTAASPRIAANEPANITGASRSRVKMTICGPMIGGEDAAGEHEGDGARLEFGRRIVGRGEAELLHESAAEPDDQQAGDEQPETRLEQRERRDQPAERGDRRCRP